METGLSVCAGTRTMRIGVGCIESFDKTDMMTARSHDTCLYREVKSILLERFHRRLESSKGGTVPGRTLDTANLAASTVNREKIFSPTPGGQSKSETKIFLHSGSMSKNA